MIGQTISHYKILEKLGEGGMGVVYKAEDTKLHRPVAVKFLPLGKTASKDQTDRFIHEARVAAGLSHPNIATVFELDEIEDTFTHTTQAFIAMEFVEGETLEEIVLQGPLPTDRVRDIGIQVAHGLLNAHQQGTIHRDIKPSNIIINKDGVVKLLDFGLAKLTQDTTIGEQRKIAGSAAYMSPEQAQGGKLDLRTDIWSVGVVLYQMLSGHLPFRGEHAPALMYSIVNEEPLSLKAFRPDVPDDLAAVCQQCLQKNPEKRPQSMQELLDILDIHASPHKAFFDSQSWRSTFARVAYSAIIVITVLSTLWFAYPSLFTSQPAKQTWRVGILPFRSLTEQAGGEDWPALIQMIMVDHLSGVPELRVVDPFSLNGLMTQAAGVSLSIPSQTKLMEDAEIELLIAGTIQSTDSGYVIYCTISQVGSREVMMTQNASFTDEHDLTNAIVGLSEQILNFFQIQTLTSSRKEDLKPWLSQRTKNLGAVKAFLQGFQLAWKMRPGGRQYYRMAIALDSTFITPRVWLLAGLVNHGELDEAHAHYEVLKRLGPSEGPFEQALIRWSKSYIDHDLSEQARALEEALEYSPRNNVLLYLLGSIRYLQDDFQGTINVIQPAIDMKWPFQPAAHLLAISHLRLQHYTTCREVLQRSLTLENVIPETYSLLAALSYRDHDFKSSEQYEHELFRRLKSEGVSRDSSLALLANDYAFIGEHAKAITCLELAIKLNSRKSSYYAELGVNHFKMRNFLIAANALQLSLRIDSTLIESHRLLGEVYEAMGDPVAALHEYKTFLQKDSTSSKAEEVKRRIDDSIHK